MFFNLFDSILQYLLNGTCDWINFKLALIPDPSFLLPIVWRQKELICAVIIDGHIFVLF